jgi:hypothetical protein
VTEEGTRERGKEGTRERGKEGTSRALEGTVCDRRGQIGGALLALRGWGIAGASPNVPAKTP